MGYRKATTEDVDSVMPDEWGGMWMLRDALETRHLGFSVAEFEPGAKGKKHSHDDGQEEVYCCVEGEIEVDVGGDTVTLRENEAVRVDPDEERQVHNRSDETARLVIAGAPLS